MAHVLDDHLKTQFDWSEVSDEERLDVLMHAYRNWHGFSATIADKDLALRVEAIEKILIFHHSQISYQSSMTAWLLSNNVTGSLAYLLHLRPRLIEQHDVGIRTHIDVFDVDVALDSCVYFIEAGVSHGLTPIEYVRRKFQQATNNPVTMMTMVDTKYYCLD